MPRRRPQIGRPVSPERIGRLTDHVPRSGLCQFPALSLSARRSDRATSCRACPDCSPAWRPVLVRNAVEPESPRPATARAKGNLRPLYCRRAGALHTRETTIPTPAGKTRRSACGARETADRHTSPVPGAHAGRAEGIGLKHPSDIECEARRAIGKQRCAASRRVNAVRSRCRAHSPTNRIGRRIHPPSRAGLSRAVAPHEGRRHGPPAHPRQ